MKLNFIKALRDRKQKKIEAHFFENHGKHLISDKSTTRILEAYRMARTNLFYTGDSTETGVVFGISSASPNDGKSLTCANIAISFAMSGKRVLLVDCDMRKPTQKIAFDVKPESGLSEYLAGVSLEPCIIPTSYDNLSILTSGRCPPNPAELLYRARFAELMKYGRENYDFVFLDLPPVGIISDAAIVAPHVQSYVLVVRVNKSDYRAIQETVETLEKVNAKIAGFILNEVDDGYSSYRYGKGYGKGYGRGYGKHYSRYGKYYSRYYDKYGLFQEQSEAAAEENRKREAEEKPSAAHEDADKAPADATPPEAKSAE